MKHSFNKIKKAGTSVILSCIIIYGVVYTQQVCCSTVADAIIPTSNRISAGYSIDNTFGTSSLHNRDIPVLINPYIKNLLADFGTGNKCCETNRCDSNSHDTYVNLSLIQEIYSFPRHVSFFDSEKGVQDVFMPYIPSTSPNAVPIYIVTRSIIS